MNNKSENKYYRAVQKYGFAVVEANLYLDTHPNDKKALEYFDKVRSLYNNAVEVYENNFGPLTALNNQSSEWKWIKGPWPWEYDAN